MNFDEMTLLQRRLHNAACVLDAEGDEFGFVALLHETIDALNAVPIKPVEYLLNGDRFKLSFNELCCDECGHSVGRECVPLDQYASELQGRWVALVPAENDQHRLMQAPNAM